MNVERMLIDGAKEVGVKVSHEVAHNLILYKDIVLEWNEKINLTAITDEKDFIIKHFLDSLTVCSLINKSGKLVDLGTGAGFPGIPIKMIYPDMEVTLVDSVDKKIKFLNEVITRLNLTKTYTKHSRAEELGKNLDFREKFDVCVARAVAGLPVLLEYCLPLVKIDGIFVALKGSVIDEIEQSKKALKVLGGEIVEVKELVLPYSDSGRTLVCVKKTKSTPVQYPRKPGKPSKEPLI